MAATLAPIINVQVALPTEATVYEGSPELVMLVGNLKILAPYMLKMMIETMGTMGTMGTTGELRVQFKDGRVVDEGPGKKRPKILLD